MAEPKGFFTLNDEGGEFLVKANAIDYLRGYEKGGATIGVGGSFHHVKEDLDRVIRLINLYKEN